MTTYTYDPAGNQLTLENPNGVTATNTYTPLDQLATTSYSDGTHEVTYTYDANGNRTAMTDASGTSTYTYDPFDELTSSENGAGKTTDLRLRRAGDKTSITYPLGAGATWATTDTVTYGYDAAGLMTSMTDFNGNTSAIANTADGLASALSLGSSGDTRVDQLRSQRRAFVDHVGRRVDPSRVRLLGRPIGRHRFGDRHAVLELALAGRLHL